LEDDIIDCFYNGITDLGIYIDFGRNTPKTVAGLRDMMHRLVRTGGEDAGAIPVAPR
jgi:hypothetical protein